MGEGQVEEQGAKLAGSEETESKGWQRVWLDSRSAEQVTRDTAQSKHNVSRFCLPAFA